MLKGEVLVDVQEEGRIEMFVTEYLDLIFLVMQESR